MCVSVSDADSSDGLQLKKEHALRVFTYISTWTQRSALSHSHIHFINASNIQLLIHSLIGLFVHLFTSQLLICPVNSLIHSLRTHSLIDFSFTQMFIPNLLLKQSVICHSFTHCNLSYIHSFIHSFNCLQIHSLTHSLIPLSTRSLSLFIHLFSFAH